MGYGPKVHENITSFGYLRCKSSAGNNYYFINRNLVTHIKECDMFFWLFL